MGKIYVIKLVKLQLPKENARMHACLSNKKRKKENACNCQNPIIYAWINNTQISILLSKKISILSLSLLFFLFLIAKLLLFLTCGIGETHLIHTCLIDFTLLGKICNPV